MTQPPDPDIEILEHAEDVEVRYLGAFSLARFKRQMEQSAKACVDRKLPRLLVNILELAGYTPITFERHQIGSLGPSSAGIASKWRCWEPRSRSATTSSRPRSPATAAPRSRPSSTGPKP